MFDLTALHFRGAVHQLALPLPALPGQIRSLAIARPDTDFTAADKDLVWRLRPALFGLDRQLRVLRRCSTPDAVRLADLRASGVRLTARELTVLDLLAEGLTAQAIARRLGVTVNTVAKHQQNLYRKMRTSDRLTTVLTALEIGILRGAQGLGTSTGGFGPTGLAKVT